MLRLAQRAPDPTLAVFAHYALGFTWFNLGVLPAARQHLEEAIVCYTPDQRRVPVFRIGQDLGVACRANAARALWVLGYPEQALVRIHEALTLAHALSHAYSLALVQWLAALVFQGAPAGHARTLINSVVPPRRESMLLLPNVLHWRLLTAA